MRLHADSQGNGNDGAGCVRYAARVLFERINGIRDETPRPAPLNMALDEVLLGEVREPLLRTIAGSGLRCRLAISENTRRSPRHGRGVQSSGG